MRGDVLRKNWILILSKNSNESKVQCFADNYKVNSLVIPCYSLCMANFQLDNNLLHYSEFTIDSLVVDQFEYLAWAVV